MSQKWPLLTFMLFAEGTFSKAHTCWVVVPFVVGEGGSFCEGAVSDHHVLEMYT